jgi:hypothetical protein
VFKRQRSEVTFYNFTPHLHTRSCRSLTMTPQLSERDTTSGRAEMLSVGSHVHSGVS